MHSLCSYFAIASTGERGQHSDDANCGYGPAAAAPRPVVQGGEVSPDGDVVAAANHGGKGCVHHPGVAQQERPQKGGRG